MLVYIEDFNKAVASNNYINFQACLLEILQRIDWIESQTGSTVTYPPITNFDFNYTTLTAEDNIVTNYHGAQGMSDLLKAAAIFIENLETYLFNKNKLSLEIFFDEILQKLTILNTTKTAITPILIFNQDYTVD